MRTQVVDSRLRHEVRAMIRRKRISEFRVVFGAVLHRVGAPTPSAGLACTSTPHAKTRSFRLSAHYEYFEEYC